VPVKNLRYAWLVVASLFVLLAPSLLGQTASTGALSGTVTDQTGAVVPNAKVTASNRDTGQARTVTTRGDGSYQIPQLPPGSYRVKFEAGGFQTVELPSVTITVTETGTLNQSLTVGSEAQQVTVEAEVEEVQTETSAMGTVIKSIADLPLPTRNYQNLISLSAGANATVVNVAASLGKDSQEVAVNGAATTDNNYQMDGAPITNFASVGNAIEGGAFSSIGIPNPDAIEEFKIQTSTFDASYGRNSGGNVNVVTKSGTNDLHGTAFEFLRNTVLNANDFFYKANELAAGKPNKQPVLNQNQYGGVLGGPVKKDKLFFFVSYQETSQKNGFAAQGSSIVQLPYITPPSIAADRTSAAFLNDMLAHYCGSSGILGGIQIMAPAGGCNSTSPFLGSYNATVATANISQQALNILQLKLPNGNYYIPSPLTGSSQVNCNPTPSLSSGQPLYTCSSSIPATYTEYQGLGNWDYVINSKHTLSGRFFVSTAPSNAPFSGDSAPLPSNTLPGNPLDSVYANTDAVLSLTSNLTSNIVNVARISYQRNSANLTSPSSFTSSQVGITPVSPSADSIPQMLLGTFGLGTDHFAGVLNLVNQYELADQLSWTHGKHSLRFGFEVEHYQQIYDFPGLSVGDIVAGPVPFISSFGDFLIGLPGCTPGDSTCSPASPTTTIDLGGQTVQNNGTPDSNISVFFATERYAPGGQNNRYFLHDLDGFIQDDFRVSSRLTLNLGLRWEYDGLPGEAHGQNTGINPSMISSVPFPLVANPCPAQTFQTLGCPGSSFAGYVVPNNYNPSRLGALPAGVFMSNHGWLASNNPPKDNFAPRLGFAWQPLAKNTRWVVRAAGGYFYDRVPADQFADVAIINIPYAFPVPTSGVFNGDLANPYVPSPASWQPRWITSSGQDSEIGGPGMGIFVTPLVYQWNLNTQYEFAPTWVIELAYVGTRGIHQWGPAGSMPGLAANPALLVSPSDPSPTSGVTTNSVNNTSLRVPYAGFSAAFTTIGTDLDFKYNSAQATVRKQLSHGLSLQGAYTWSRAFVTSEIGNPNASLSDNVPLLLKYGLNPNYHPQRLALTYSWDLPFGHPDGLKGKLVTGWTISGVTVIQDGTPLTITDASLGTIFGSPIASNAQFAAGMGNASVATTGSLYHRVVSGAYFNSSAFVVGGGPGNVIGDGTGFGNSGLGIILGPGQSNWDISLAKITKVGGLREDATFEFRAEFLDAFNHPQFDNPSSLDVTNGSFGTILGASVNPRLIQFGLKYRF
jgi:carboxypeptidase family protein